jgi:hypothetical protein
MIAVLVFILTFLFILASISELLVTDELRDLVILE